MYTKIENNISCNDYFVSEYTETFKLKNRGLISWVYFLGCVVLWARHAACSASKKQRQQKPAFLSQEEVKTKLPNKLCNLTLWFICQRSDSITTLCMIIPTLIIKASLESNWIKTPNGKNLVLNISKKCLNLYIQPFSWQTWIYSFKIDFVQLMYFIM